MSILDKIKTILKTEKKDMSPADQIEAKEILSNIKKKAAEIKAAEIKASEIDGGMAPEPEIVPPEYLQHSTEVIGYANRDQQYFIYDLISRYINYPDSILHFGCGRGDLYTYFINKTQQEPNYLGLDLNEHLIKAGNIVNGDVKLHHTNWFDYNSTEKSSWSVNILACDRRYDASIIPDDEYLLKTIDKMMESCSRGSILILPCNTMPEESKMEGFIYYNVGDTLNKLLNTYKKVYIDHTIVDGIFLLMITK